MHGENNFAESKNLTRYRFENNLLLDYQNYYVGCSSIMSNAAKKS